jgi:SNF2 family DNA or RNA helicase
MPLFSKGERVCCKANLSIRGTIAFVAPLSGGKQFYDMKRDDGALEAFYEEQLMKETLNVDCWEMLSKNALSSYLDFGIGASLYKIRNAATNTIPSLKASRTKFKPYQFKALVKFLNSSTKRLLIADEVGLGKTIEAGHIVLEMAGRGLLRNCLIVCTKSLQEKWQLELREKFGFEFKICEIPELINDINRDINTSQKTVFAIVNYEKCRNKAFRIMVDKSGYGFDLVICDEAHKLRNSPTQLHKAIHELLKISDASIFLTATPIMTDIENLYSLVHLLEPERYFNFELFRNAINTNRPFIKASNQLKNHVSLAIIAEELHKAEVHLSVTIGDTYVFSESKTVASLFESDPLYQRARGLMLGKIDTLELRARIMSDLTDLNSLNHLYSRNRKREVLTKDEVIVRNPYSLFVTLSPEERKVFDDVLSQYGDGNMSLGLITRKRQVASSIIGFLSDEDDLKRGKYDRSIPDSKYKVFRQAIEEIVLRDKSKMIVFATYKNTLRYLQARLHEEGIQCELIHGDVPERNSHISNFRESKEINILLSSEVGSEGLDLQFAHVIINYDLPWNPMVVEQRIGRVDRVGQESKIVNVYSLVARDTIEERIYQRLLERINVFKESLGDLEEILGEGEEVANDIEDMFKRLYLTNLTIAQQNRIIDEIALAVENQRETLKKVTADLTNSVVYDIFFADEISSIINNNRYLTEQELKGFLEALFRLKLTTCQFHQIDEHIYRIEFPNSNPNILFNFLDEHRGSYQGNPMLERRFMHFLRHSGRSSISLTFNQDYAFQNPQIEFVNSSHPLIYAGADWLLDQGYHRNRAYRLAIQKEQLNVPEITIPGHYILAVFNISLIKGQANDHKTFHYVHAALIDANGNEPKLLSRNAASFVLGKAQLFAGETYTDPMFDQAIVDTLRLIISREIKECENDILQNEQIRLSSDNERTLSQLKLFYENQISRKRSLLQEGHGIKDILQSEINKLEREYQYKLETTRSSTLECRNELISINYLQIQ